MFVFMKTRRTHDSLYLNENRYDDAKEQFKFIVNHSFEEDEFNSSISICDVGSAAGEFLYYLNSIAPNIQLTGFDVMEDLLEKSKKYVPNASYKTGSVLDIKNFDSNQFEKTFLTGVHMIFHEFETPITNLIYWTKPGGKVVITGLFNSFPVDVYIKYKESKNYQSEYFEEGWNMFSIESISKFLNTLEDVKSFDFKKFNIGIDLDKQSDIIRSWTFKDIHENRFITNGLSIIQQQYSLIINL